MFTKQYNLYQLILHNTQNIGEHLEEEPKCLYMIMQGRCYNMIKMFALNWSEKGISKTLKSKIPATQLQGKIFAKIIAAMC